MIASHSPVVGIGIRAASPLAIMVGVYLLLAGHNNPGGGFAAGLVFGAVIILRAVAGLQRPTHATGLIAGGILVAIAIVALPLVWDDVLLDQAVWSVELPLLGKVKGGTALAFDVGITAIVVGLVIAFLDGLSAISPKQDPAPTTRRNHS